MKTGKQINKKKRLERDIMQFVKVNQLKLLKKQAADSYQIFEKDFCILKIDLDTENFENHIMIKMSTLFMEDIKIFQITLLRTLFGEKDVRDMLSTDRLILRGETMYLYRELKVQIDRPHKSNFLFKNISELLYKSLNGSSLLQSKIDYTLQIKLN